MVTLLLGIASVGFAAPTDDGLVLYYSFDGSDAKNQASSGSALDGVVTGVEFVDGVSGKAASFNADDSSNIVFNMTSGLPSFTVSFWYQVPAPSKQVCYNFLRGRTADQRNRSNAFGNDR